MGMRNIIVGQSAGRLRLSIPALRGFTRQRLNVVLTKYTVCFTASREFLDEQYVDLSTQIHSDMDIELLK